MPEQPMTEYDRARISLSGLTRPEAQEFNKFFLISFVVFTLIAIVAHILVWSWRPWLQGGRTGQRVDARRGEAFAFHARLRSGSCIKSGFSSIRAVP